MTVSRTATGVVDPTALPDPAEDDVVLPDLDHGVADPLSLNEQRCTGTWHNRAA